MTTTFASELLSRCGVRLIELDGVMSAGIWSWLNSIILREAIATFSPDAPILYLDGNGIPDRYKEYRGAPDLEKDSPFHNPSSKSDPGWDIPILPVRHE